MPANQQTSPDATARPYLYDVFLSHHSSDKPLVEMIAARLEDEAGLKPFLDKWHLVPGEPWAEELEAALDQSATCAVFLGPSGLGAWHNEEMRAALDEGVRNKSFRVVPVLLPGAEPKDKNTLPRFLRRLTWIDFRAGLNDQEAFHRLVAGIKGLPPGRQPTSPFAEGKPAPLKEKAKKNRTELWKIVAGAVLALLFAIAFIGAARPRYKVQIKPPVIKRDGVFESSPRIVTLRWTMLKEQWFREVDVSNVKATVIIKNLDDETEDRLPDSSGEMTVRRKAGRYEVHVDVDGYQSSEIIPLEIPAPDTVALAGMVVDQNDRPVQGAKVTIDDMPGMESVETASNGVFRINEIPKRYFDMVRVRVDMEGYPKPTTQDVIIGSSPRIKLRR